ncbi:molecular chaperone Hsp90 [Pseudonocardia xishanensis]|uniref:Molecular chaperone Hsp90 n=1 Tax=Pseudonocardia xishanensis TaxID=630995 RepID=A0ABP8RK86_9PSEU
MGSAHDGAELWAANTGAPLDAAGVEALASLRASAKRDDPGSAGRFGVGFAAVLPLTSAPRLVTGPGVGVRFSAADTVAAVGSLPGPAAELARRDGHVPVLRLVWPVDPDEPGPPAGFATEVRLPLRAGLSADALLAEARAAAPDLLLALPDLESVTVGDVEVTRSSQDAASGGTASEDTASGDIASGDTAGVSRVVVGERAYLVVRRSVVAEPGAAVEERARRRRSLCWALPLDAAGAPAPFRPDSGEVLHAPTPGAERLGLPARLIADLPLDPDRRRVRPGPATDAVLAAAAEAYVDLVRAVPPEHRLALVPPLDLPLSELDGRVRAATLEALAVHAWLPAAGGRELAPRRAEWLDLPGAEGLAGVLAAADAGFEGLAEVDPAFAPQLAALGARRVPAAELTDRLHAVEQGPSWWRGVYAALEPAVETVPGLAQDLRALPVPLLDGRLVSGPPTVLTTAGELTGAERAVAALALPGLHVVDPAAVHPLLARLGACEVDGAALLNHPALREAVERSVDDAEAGLDPEPLAAAVLGLLRDPVPGLGGLALPDAEGVPSRADELLLPDAAVRALVDPDAPIGVLAPEWAARFPREALVAAGVLDGFAVVVDEEPAGPDHDLHDEDLWWDEREPTRVVAVRDLDLVADAAWPAALALLACAPGTRAALLEPGGYTGWWLARHALLGGREPGYWRLPSADGLAGLYDPVPAVPTGAVTPNRGGIVDEAVLTAVGVRSALGVADTEDAADLLDRLADPGRTVGAGLGARAHAVLAAAVADGLVDVAALELPDHVRSLAGTVVPVDDAVVLDAPWTAAVLPAAELVVGGEPAALAEILDLPLASEVVRGEVVGDGEPVAWSDLPDVVVACRTADLAVPPGELRLHDRLEIDLERPEKGRFRVPTWVDARGTVHADDPLRALLALPGWRG